MQLRYKTGLTGEQYVRAQAWRAARLERCPNHPHGGCSLARHGTYTRKTPRGTRIARWYCPESHTTISLLPDCLAARLPGELDELEAVVAHAEQAPSRAAAANALRRDAVELPGAMRWVERRVRLVHHVVSIVIGLLPEPLARCIAEMGAVRARHHWPANAFKRIAVAVADWVREAWDYETLEENVETTASNESSVVQMAEIDGHRLLLTGDAGIVSLKEAADCAEGLGYYLPGVRLIQIPHHGSRHNVSPSILDRWLGPRIGQGATPAFSAYASVAKGSKSHPRRKVVNAFMRRGAAVFSTKGEPKLFHYQMNHRRWGPAEPESFSDQVET